MTFEEAVNSYRAAVDVFNSMGAIGGFLADSRHGGPSIHISDDNWKEIPGIAAIENHDDKYDKLIKINNGIAFFTLVNKKAAPQEADNKNTTTTVPEIAAACNGREECFEKCVAKDDFTCCLKCESLSECPTNCREAM